MRELNRIIVAMALLLFCSQLQAADPVDTKKTTETKPVNKVVPDPTHVGGETGSVVQVANLVYAGSKSSECFADHFLIRA